MQNQKQTKWTMVFAISAMKTFLCVFFFLLVSFKNPFLACQFSKVTANNFGSTIVEKFQIKKNIDLPILGTESWRPPGGKILGTPMKWRGLSSTQEKF
jgi:hypothetical protein